MSTSSTATYQCHAFHNALPGGKAAGELQISPQGIHYYVGELRGQLPFSQLSLTLGGASDRLLFIKHPFIPELTLYTSDLTLLKNPIMLAHPECAAHIHRARHGRRKNWGIFAAISLFIIAIPLFLVWNMNFLSGIVAKQVPVSWETKLGESVAAQYRITHKTMDKEKVDERLKPLINPLLGALKKSPYHYQFSIVNDSTLNAFALPGGFVTINSGLILKAGSAEELLGVLAHEISHVEERHGVRSIVSNAGIYLVASAVLGDVSGILATISSAAPMLISQRYSRNFETDADENAARLMQNAHVDPEGLPRFFEKMIAEEKAMFDKIESEEARTAYKTALTFLSTHPASEERMKHLRELANKKQESTINLDTEFKTLQNAVREFVELSPDTSTTTTQSNKENTSEGDH